MKLSDKNITILSEDIQQIVSTACGEKLDMLRFCRDHPNPILLQDKRPVLDISQDDFVGIFDLKSNHYFLSPGQVCRVGKYCTLTLPSIIALMLKAEWQSHFAEVSGFLQGSEPDLGSRLRDHRLIGEHISAFKPGRDKIYNLLRKYPEVSGKKTTYSKCDFYIRDLLEDNTFLKNNELIARSYPDEVISEKMILHKVTESQQAAYFRQKERWNLKSGELDEMLLNLERRKRMNQNIEDRYYRAFYKDELLKSKLKYRIEKYRIILKLMQKQAGQSYRELWRLAEDKMMKSDLERTELKKKITRSLTYIGDPGLDTNEDPVSAEFRNAYMDACKKLLKKLFFLLHSDTCPSYHKLSRKKQGQINELWMKLMKGSREESYSLSQSMMLYSLPDFEKLESIYKRACEILDISPENFEIGNRLEFMISIGTPGEELIEFLEHETESLELHLAHLELIQNEYSNEDKTQAYREALNDISFHSANLNKEITELREELRQLKEENSSGLLLVVKS